MNIMFYILCFSLAFTQSESHEFAGTKVANWLKIENGTRAIGMSGAHTASGRGVASIQYNPASITHVSGTELYYNQSKYIAGITKNVLGYGLKLSPYDYFGMNLFYLNSGDIEVTTERTPTGTGEMYQVLNLCLSTAYARKVGDNLRVGATVKIVREDIYTAYMNSYAFDFGGTYTFKPPVPIFPKLTLGLSFSNIGPEVKFYGQGLDQTVSTDLSVDEKLSRVSESFQLPMVFRFGVSTPSPLSIAGNNILVALDLVKPDDNFVSLNSGFEYSWKDMVYIRSGYHLGHDSAGLSAGFGLKWRAIELDLAYTDYQIFNSNNFSNPYQMGLIFSF